MRLEVSNDSGEISGLTKFKEKEKRISNELEYSFAVHH